ncbi:MAG: carboxypeptidase-like regulatory domain-containing protein, partial [Bacteroidales bacterium]|nr:carboxypeptidase-like regulatory domain-containing protein [Bacteroidales bacterium]
MKNFYVKAFFICCVGILISINSFGTGTIKGTVTYHDLFGMDNIELYLYDFNENIVDSTITNSVGFYIFNQIPFGDYILRGNVDQLAF